MSVKSAVGREGDVGVELTFKTMNLKKASMKEWGQAQVLRTEDQTGNCKPQRALISS